MLVKSSRRLLFLLPVLILGLAAWRVKLVADSWRPRLLLKTNSECYFGLFPINQDSKKLRLSVSGEESILKKAKFTEGQIAQILQEVPAGRSARSDSAASTGSAKTRTTLWKRKYRRMVTDDVRRLKELEPENAQLKRVLAEQNNELFT